MDQAETRSGTGRHDPPVAFGIDVERVASLLDGQLRGTERDALLVELVASDADFEAFADTAAVLREAESEDPER